jgi:hypothetical protein
MQAVRVIIKNLLTLEYIDVWQPPYKHRSFLAITQDSAARSWHCELVKKLSGYSLGDELSTEQKTRLASW